ncbi:hypothetical protein SLNWT_4420 [Streptomyces albus]|uniref:Uncharacterized protein n=1 Tax=Streptomyces albus (strain ATCC 21838 / DSM 41398 / FERM P-419 / JCM 4703 / NBRC 107858) TaxID=1081613 RepID=A0A0B5F1Q0_STRA4|nr:hypothetical protein SLNWT_4420 [Streptomyces albus]AOU79101.1 hypothetical protein SLNHY_4410 [Streptomyces albus]AYN34836.1 hypothetical protein DUI70_4336 [Streptomyces albus]
MRLPWLAVVGQVAPAGLARTGSPRPDRRHPPPRSRPVRPVFEDMAPATGEVHPPM